MKSTSLLPGVIISAFVANGCASIAVPDDSVKLATFNIRCPVDASPNSWEERKERCRRIIQNNKLDIFGVQEAHLTQINDLLENTNYSFIGAGRSDFKNTGEFSAILYDKNRFEIIKSGTFGLSETPDIPGCKSWGAAYPRIATFGLFRDRISGKKFIYYNTHLDHVSSLARVNGIKLLLEHASENAKGLPLIITGDFNARPNSAVYKIANSILKDSAIVSLTPHQGPLQSFNNYGKSKSKNPIDFIFVSEEFTVYSHKNDNTLINGMYPSDHFPVIAELSITK